MLISINEKWAIKTDRYQYMLCIDKGETKFPKGLIAPLYSPSKYCSTLNGTLNAKSSKEDSYHSARVLENEQVHACYIAACEKEVELYELFNKIKNTKKSSVIYQSKIEYSRNHYIVTLPIRNEDGSVEKLGAHHVYLPTYASAVMTCYSFYLKEHPRFGSPSTGSTAESGDKWADVCNFMDETENMIKEIIDKN